MKDLRGYDPYRYDAYTLLGSASETGEHVVEDARSKTAPKTEPHAKRTQKRKRGKLLLTVMITILSFSATLFAADLLSGRGEIAEYVALFGKSKTSSDLSFYAVYASKGVNAEIAYKNAAAVRAEGGAGYVLKEDETYYVILNVYRKEADAKSVSAKKTNYDILEITAPEFDAAKAPSLKEAEASKEIFLEAYETLYKAANDLASGTYGEEDMRRTLLSEKERISAHADAYNEAIRGKEDTQKIEYKVLFAELLAAYENLTGSSEALVADARYYSVMILHSYALFAKKYFS